MAPWILVTPASRGIGLEVARRLLRTTQLPIVVTARSNVDKTKDQILASKKYDHGDAQDNGVLLSEADAEAMGREGDSSRVHSLSLDMTDEASIVKVSEQCEELFGKPKGGSDKGNTQDLHHLQLALALPGILYPEKSPAQLDEAQILETFKVNTIGPLLLLKHFSKFLPRKSSSLPSDSPEEYGPLPRQAVWATMSARVGSIQDNQLGGWYSYRASKAAVNQVAKTFDNFLKTTAGDNAMSISLHPGTVRTGLSKEFWGNVQAGKLFSPEYAAQKLVEVISNRSTAQRGRCFDWKGEEIPA